MEDVIIRELAPADDELVWHIKTLRRPKNRHKRRYRGVLVCNKTPVRLRGTQVEIRRIGPTRMRNLKRATWQVRDVKSRRVVSYANEIYLTGVSFEKRGRHNLILGTVVPPSEAGRLLTQLVATDPDGSGRYFPAAACDHCRDHRVLRGAAAARLTAKGVFI